MERNKNCAFVNLTHISPFNRCKYCDRRTSDCFGMQFLAIGLVIVALLIVTLFVTDLPALALDMIITIVFLISILSYLAFKETNEISLSRAMLEKLNIELEQNVQQRTADLKRSNEELEKAIQTKNEFLGVINHELKTPITAVLSGIEVIKAHGEDKFDESQKKMIDVMQKSGQDMLRLANNLLDLSKIESGKFEMNPENFPLISLLEEVVQSLKPEADKKHVKVSTQVDDSISNIYADSSRLKQVLFNLIDNAIKYNKDNGSVEVKALALNNHIEMEIRDTGIGIKEEQIKNIFDKFTRFVSGVKGTGLGLYISKSFIEAHKGEIKVESKYGEGSTFRIIMPKILS